MDTQSGQVQFYTKEYNTALNLIDHGDCESATPPAISGITPAAPLNATFARSSVQSHGGSFSYLLTKSGSGASVAFLGTTTGQDLLPGHTYTLSGWAYVPSVSGISAGRFNLKSFGGATPIDTNYAINPALTNQWQFISGTASVPSDATGSTARLVCDSGAGGLLLNVDDITLVDLSAMTFLQRSMIGSEGDYELLANQGNCPDAKLGERSWICTVCNQAFPESKIRKFRGKIYCIPNGDYKDIASILKTESARRYKPAGIGTERIVLPIIKG